MNSQPQATLDAAKIAAETAANNAEKTLVITVIMALFSFLGVLLSAYISSKSAEKASQVTENLGEQNLDALKEKRYIDAISTERIKWINTMRDNFSAFVKNVNLQVSDIRNLTSEQQKLKDICNKMNGISELNSKQHKVVEEKMIERLNEIMYIGNHIYFLLNPTEPICEEIRKLQLQIWSSLEKFNGTEFDYTQMSGLIDDLAFFYQVVLKSEWKRVKEENKTGEEIDDVTLNDIYIGIAKKLDENVYNKYFNQSES
ncbi:hypothetical protein CU072_27770 [Bacillus thuringiensis]|uniref:hypothetical protein n=1 Tax=Bacillus thuringiensis TaxID=1428 RepID=UPI000D6B6C90|nr:hypothetical protein [Bacillus thuringiensis]PWN12158.1 hypothetical protein CU072_27770 [Bacillus thuringiensis]